MASTTDTLPRQEYARAKAPDVASDDGHHRKAPTEEALVTSVRQLVAATTNAEIRDIVVRGHLVDAPSLRLAPGQRLHAEDDRAAIDFAPGADGVQISENNALRGLRLCTAPERRAIFNDTSVEHLGRLALHDLTVTGRVLLLARDAVRGGHVEVSRLDIISADSRGERDRPKSYGVDVLQGAFTLWNLQSDDGVVVSADLRRISAGRNGAPVRGSGVFVSGAGDRGGRLVVSRLETDAIYSDGGIAPGAANQTAAGVFTSYGAHVERVRTRGRVVTYGVNDMVLDNWGSVDRWIVEAKIVSHGTGGIGLVNFGRIDRLRVRAPIETFGQRARGFSVQAGSVSESEFDRITTHGDGAVGVQISQPIGRLVVRRGIETFGGTGPSLVKGVVATMSAVALSIRPGGSAREIEIDGGLRTNGAGMQPIEQHGSVESLRIGGGCIAAAHPMPPDHHPPRQLTDSAR